MDSYVNMPTGGAEQRPPLGTEASSSFQPALAAAAACLSSGAEKVGVSASGGQDTMVEASEQDLPIKQVATTLERTASACAYNSLQDLSLLLQEDEALEQL